MNIFKSVESNYLISCVELSRVELNTKDYYVCKKRVEALGLVLKVLKSMSWVKREEVKKKIIFFMENNYDYGILAETFGTSRKSAYVMVSRASKQFKETIGINNVDELLVDDFSIENIRDDSIVNIFISDVQEQLEVRESVEIDILECMLELTALRSLTKASLSNRLKKLDVDKIAHILFILQCDITEYTLERELLKNYMIGSIKSKEELEMRLSELYNL